MLGAAGPAIVFVCSIAALSIFGPLLITFLAHYFLIAFEDTALGEETVAWMPEPIFEILWKPIYLLGILIVPLGPIAVLLVGMAPWLARDLRGPVVFVAIIVWLVFPVLLLSSYFSGRWWSLSGTVLAGLARNGRITLVYFLLSALLLITAAACAWFALRGDIPSMLTATAVAGAMPLLFGRLLGRLAWVIDNPKRRKRRKKRVQPAPTADAQVVIDDEPPEPALSATSDHVSATAASVQQTTIFPQGPLDEAEDEWDRYKKPYRVMTDAEVEIAAMKKDAGLDPGVVGPLTNLPPLGAERKPQKEAKKKRGHSVFAILVSGVWTFPFHDANPGKWLNATFLILVVALLVRVILLVRLV